MITNYNKYVNIKLNEELGILASLKTLFGKLLQNLSDDIKKPIEDLTNKLSKTKDIKTVNTYIITYLKVQYESLIKAIDSSTSIIGLVKVVNDNLIAIYVSIDAVIKNLGDDTYTFEELFKNAPEQTKKLFSKNEANFNKNVKLFCENLVASFGKPFNLGKDVIDFKEEQQIVTAQGEELSDENKIKLENFNKLKGSIKTWFDNTLYKPLKTELTVEVKSGGGDETPTTTTTATKNTDGVNKMIADLKKLKDNTADVDKLADSINQLSDAKQLATIRDLLIKLGYGKLEDYGKF